MGLGRAHDAVVGVPPVLVVDVVARKLDAHTVGIDDRRESLVGFVLWGVENIIVVGIMCGQSFDKDTTIIGGIVILHDDPASTVTYYHNLLSVLMIVVVVNS